MASKMPAMTKARARRLLENLSVAEDGVSALVGCLLGSGGGGIIVAGLSPFSTSIGLLNTRRSNHQWLRGPAAGT